MKQNLFATVTRYRRRLLLTFLFFLSASSYLLWRWHILHFELMDREFRAINVFLAHKYYGDAFGSLPCLVNDGVNPPRTWRIDLYSYTGSGDFRVEYDLSLPFDAAKNLIAADRVNKTIPGSHFRFEADHVAKEKNYTTFLRISGKGTFGEGFWHHKPALDGNDKTILFVIFKNSGVYWTAPIDLEVLVSEDLERQPINTKRWFAEKDRIVVFGSGDMRRLSRTTSFKEFVAMCTTNGNESLDVTVHNLLYPAIERSKVPISKQ